LIDDKINELESPCDNYDYWECKKNPLQEDIIKNKYKLNVIGWRRCLRETKKELLLLKKLARQKEFDSKTIKICRICKKRVSKYDMRLFFETKKELVPKNIKFKDKYWHHAESFWLCQKCSKSYTHRKRAISGEDYKKFY